MKDQFTEWEDRSEKKAVTVRKELTVQDLIDWLSLLDPTQTVRAWSKGQDIEFNPLLHVDHDRNRHCIIIDLD